MSYDKKNAVNNEYSVSSKKSGKAIKNQRQIILKIPEIRNSNIYKLINLHKLYLVSILILFVVSLLGGYLGAVLENHLNNNFGSISTSLLSKDKIVTTQGQLISSIAKSVGPSVVSVNVTINTTSASSSLNSLFGFSPTQTTEQAEGTGIILTTGGLIITNRHVVPVGTTNVSVTLSNGVQLNDVSVIGRTSQNSSLDVAFLKINNLDGQKLIPASIGNSNNVQIGDSVVAIGNALGQFQNTVTSGIISGFGRSVVASSSSGGSSLSPLFGTSSTGSSENLTDLFQTDAAINEGNSGGPLVNLNGQVIGINTAIAGNAQNIGFAIPINDVTGLINQVLKTGKFSAPYLGVLYVPITSDIQNQYNLPVSQGAFIPPSTDTSSPSVIPNSPAANAGLQQNDIITKLNGISINQSNSLTGLIDQYSPGDKVILTVIRGSKTISIPVTIGSDPSQ